MNAKVNLKNTKDDTNLDYKLTDKEIEILKHLVNGLEYKEIAELVSSSPNTVRNHITNIYKKLHVTSKAQAIRLAINKKWFGVF
jgi:DNA-binding NarL/FixJ family response regulator